MWTLMSPSEGAELEAVESVEESSAFRLDELDMVPDILCRLYFVVIW